MITQFKGFVESLETDEQATLFGSFSLLFGLVAVIDGRYTFRESLATYRSELKVEQNLDPDFIDEYSARHDDIERHLNVLSSKLHDKAERRDASYIKTVLDEQLSRLQRLIAKMPGDLGERYKKYLVEGCIRVADASGGFLWFGESIGPQEKQLLLRIIDSLDLADLVTDGEIRRKLDLD